MKHALFFSVLGFLLLGISCKIFAQYPVYDAASYSQLASQLNQMANEYQKQLEQLNQAIKQTQASTGTRGMGSLANSPLEQELRRYLPNSWQQTMSMIGAASENILQGAGWQDLGQYLYAFAVWLGALGITGYAAMLIILAKLAVAVLLAIGPLFILLLMFANTRSLFDGWLRTLLGYGLIPVFVYALLSILLTLAEAPLRQLENTSGAEELISVVGPFLLINFIATLLLAQILNIAGSVTGGGSLSTMGLAKSSFKFAQKSGAWSWQKIESARINGKTSSGTAPAFSAACL